MDTIKRVCVLSIDGKDYMVSDGADPVAIMRAVEGLQPLNRTYKADKSYQRTVQEPIRIGIEYLPEYEIAEAEAEEPEPEQVSTKQDPF